jgi:acyl-CoA thioesterase I
MTLIFKPNQTILFIGDSITDGGRTRTDLNHLGLTYAGFAAGLIQNICPELRLKFYNRGIVGNSVRELASRWDSDVIPLKPDWLSISIGINDVWRGIGDKPGNTSVPLEEFERIYRSILDRTKKELPRCRFILMETSVIEQDFDSEGNRRLEKYNETIGDIAHDYNSILVPVRSAWETMLSLWPDYQWTNDGVHTSAEGSVLMALCWCRAVGLKLKLYD